MGFYIEVSQTLDKANAMADQHEAVTLDSRPDAIPDDKVLLCVVQNGSFDAIAVAYNNDEADAFDDPSDGRPKTWMLLDKHIARELCPKYDKWCVVNV